jgi:hypothetical protein
MSNPTYFKGSLKTDTLIIGGLELDMPFEFDGSVEVDGDLTVTGELGIEDNTFVDGNLSATGSVTGDTFAAGGVYTVASPPDGSVLGVGAFAFFEDGAGGNPVYAFWDGSDWLRFDTRAAVDDGS